MFFYVVLVPPKLKCKTILMLVLYCAVLCCAVLCCAVLCCAVLCCAVLCCAVLCCAVLCGAVLCCAVRSGPVLCCAVLCCAVGAIHHRHGWTITPSDCLINAWIHECITNVQWRKCMHMHTVKRHFMINARNHICCSAHKKKRSVTLQHQFWQVFPPFC